MVSLIDRYIARLFLGFFLGGLLVFVSLYLSFDLISALSRFDVDMSVLLRYYGYSLPEIIYQMIPLSALLGTVFTLSTMNRANELIVLYSSGVSLARISAPILVIVGAISVLSYWMGDRILPAFAQKKNYVYFVEIKKKPSLYSTVKTNKIWYRSRNILFNIQTLKANINGAQGLAMYYFSDDWRLIQLIKAKEVSMNGEEWQLSNGTVTVFAQETSFPLTKQFQKKSIIMSKDAGDLGASSNSADVLNNSQLKKFVRQNKKAGLDTARYEVDLHAKFAFAFAAFVMSFLGIPFSLTRPRAGGAIVNAGICLGLTFLYWSLYSSFITLGRHNYFPPILAAWSPNILMMSISMIFLIRLKR